MRFNSSGVFPALETFADLRTVKGHSYPTPTYISAAAVPTYKLQLATCTNYKLQGTEK